MSTTGPDWWRDAVIYQVYLQSFADSDGDGVGDVNGLRSRLEYLAGLGVDALWITPWCPSPMHDGGYDVADYRDIEPTFGTLEDARTLVAQAHALGLRLVIDLVANHTSSEHAWFRAALAAAPGSRERARYHFRDGTGPDGDRPPNDWISAFGGPAWTRVTEPDGSPGQWYLHLFAPQQPDLNWDDEQVQDEFEDVVRFWFDLGIDGLRVDAASAFAKHPDLPDHGFTAQDSFSPRHWESSPLWDVDAVHDIFRRWRAVADTYDPPRIFVGEVTVKGADRLARYLRPDELHTAFSLDFLKTAWEAGPLRTVIDSDVAGMAAVGAPATWVLSNHDETRHVTRYGRELTGVVDGRPATGPVDVALGTRRARAALLLMLALPGSVYLYQGEELGLWEVLDLPDAARRDPMWFRTAGAVRGRDGCRVPLPWNGSEPPYGFGPGSGQPWLPQPQGWAEVSVERQEGDPSSMLALYRAAVPLRRSTRGERAAAPVWHPCPVDVLDFDFGPGLRCTVNLGGGPVPVPGRVLLASGPLTGDLLPTDTAVWTRPQENA